MKCLRCLLFVLIASVFVHIGLAQIIKCHKGVKLESWNWAHVQQDMSALGPVVSMNHTKEHYNGQELCVANETYGFNGSIVWADKGCRADFEICCNPEESTPRRFAKLNVQLADDKEKAETQDALVKALRQQIKAQRVQLEGQHTSIESNKLEIYAQQKELTARSQTIQAHTSAISTKDVEIAALENELEGIRDELDGAKGEIAGMAEESSGLRREIGALRAELAIHESE